MSRSSEGGCGSRGDERWKEGAVEEGKMKKIRVVSERGSETEREKERESGGEVE